ncbi:MAG: hypothetical protein RIR01_2321 [Bacteroidota bacterium]|jgi:hypothetical protein
MYWTAFIAYLLTKDIYFAILQMTMLLAWYFDGRLGKVFNNEVNVITQNDSLTKKIENIEQSLEMFRPEKVVKGNELIFISRIHKLGYGVEIVSNHKMQDLYGKDDFHINNLSISSDTYIASGFSTFVVQLKPKE